MSAHTKCILQAAQENKELATEIYCELYIYNHYNQDEVGVDMQAFSYQYKGAITENDWLDNLIYRLSSIFRRRGLSIALNLDDIADLLTHSNELGVAL